MGADLRLQQVLLAVLLCLSCAAAAKQLEDLSSFTLPPNGWTFERQALPSDSLKLYVALDAQNDEWLTQTLLSVSDLRSSSYGAHPSMEEVRERTRAPRHALPVLKAWLRDAGVQWESVKIGNDMVETMEEQILRCNWLTLAVTVEEAASLLGQDLSDWVVYQHGETGVRATRAIGGYSVPEDVAEVTAFVGGVSHFPGVLQLPKRGRASFATPPDYAIVNPEAIRNHYNISTDYWADAATSTSSQSVSEYDNQWYSEEDLSLFFERNQLPNDTIVQLVGYNDPTTDGGEAELDIQYLMGVGVNVPTWFVSLDYTTGDPLLEWIILMLYLGDEAPLLHSTSYGADEHFLSDVFLARVVHDLKAFGTTGHTVFFSSGDSGVGCACHNQTTEKYVAHFPASSPWVTAIGATISLPNVVNGTEVSTHFTGGGFSNRFPRMDYQEEAVSNFLSTSQNLPPSGSFNSSNRAYPDMSCWGLNYEIYEHGGLDYIGGTSASTYVEGMFALINDQRLQAGMPPLGFINPAIYQIAAEEPTAFLDITIGNNGNQPCCPGFYAKENYDPLSGVGSPNFQVLLDLFMSAQA